MSYMIKNDEDRLSSLPEEVVSHILSLMPTKFAVRTSILSWRWRYSWMSVTNLDFDDRHPYHDLNCFTKFVDRVLELQKSPQVKVFRMCFSEMWVKKSNVSKWIDVAVRLNVSELDVQSIVLEVPVSLFTCRTLTKLKLAHNTRDWDVWECSSPVNLPCLKTLDIYVIANPFVNAFKLLPGCPVLENLYLCVTCKGEKEEYIFNIPTLKRLELTWHKHRPVNDKVVLQVPNLEYLSVTHMFGRPVVKKELSSLIDQPLRHHMWVKCLKEVGLNNFQFKE
ncbi:putative F-box domain, leucine-rich repeat domain superfamily, F-box-like domain superfamily [Helianthus annuus]|uniref:F-box domain, leucine-rich repeat domain superfamily, F-box-like domain superfamily n=1 Tax=Helianthus annuus TaxID=4232 RepID=A0A251RTK0_HELAN|nr:F-box/LRR-repeat protein At4g14103 [Helianthus annuus]XP_022023010.1 F-box/LRR-repeat protein At4g14103 [Helianthus annuus]KAF5757133.1 putative F-box domain, leucine-rich repeat domain superfamily, F-box-like domain superfamily [Helianthus annuus]KAJ0430562.1 putative F-box domain, leucine-rich repeat domain superfamily, F-box-like domain superfamily [Helianthus annuus]KAJ0435452.1 putative F-box domain, leucine-rich repeat domain superfamily, F-box-like domain superfamily [Helianthus annuu